MKKLLKKILPTSVLSILSNLKKNYDLSRVYTTERKNFAKYSTTNQKLDSCGKLRYRILKDYHAIEKGLTLPNPRMAFGKQRIIDIWINCNKYLEIVGEVDKILADTFATLLEYKQFHEDHNATLEPIILEILNKVVSLTQENNILATEQPEVSNSDYFKHSSSSFLEFSYSRKSIRDFSDEKVLLETIKDILTLTNNVPSACNRQAAQAFVFTSKDKIEKILEFQNGNAGFTEKINTLFVVTADNAAFYDAMERNQAYIDGGIYTMNLMYAIHYYKLAACTLNCSNLPSQDKALQKICNIPNSHVFIGMIAVGHALENVKYCNSFRNNLDFSKMIF